MFVSLRANCVAVAHLTEQQIFAYYGKQGEVSNITGRMSETNITNQ
jgi:hypothetical protein